jgi:hypothetical protein
LSRIVAPKVADAILAHLDAEVSAGQSK